MATKGQQGRRKKQTRAQEPRDEFDQMILDLARVTRVMAGGKRMRFRACVAIGDHKGRVGIGIAKGADVQLAISKAVNDAKKKVIRVPLTETGTIPHAVRVRAHSAQLLLKPAPVGSGVIAGSVVRQVFDLAGVRDIVGKIFGTSNKVNNARAVVAALSQLKAPRKPMKEEKKPTQGGSDKSEKKADTNKTDKKPAAKKADSTNKK